MENRTLKDLVFVLLRTHNTDIWDLVTKRLEKNLGVKKKEVWQYGNTLTEKTIKDPVAWMCYCDPKLFKVIIIRPEGWPSMKWWNDELYKRIETAFNEHVKACYFLQTSDLEEVYNGDVLKKKLEERMLLLEKKIKHDLEN